MSKKSSVSSAAEVTNVRDDLSQMFPHAHPAFADFALAECEAHNTHDHDYSKGGPPLGGLRRTAKIMSLYKNFPYASTHGLAAILALLNTDGVLWKLSTGRQDEAGKNLVKVGVYNKIVACALTERK